MMAGQFWQMDSALMLLYEKAVIILKTLSDVTMSKQSYVARYSCRWFWEPLGLASSSVYVVLL